MSKFFKMAVVLLLVVLTAVVQVVVFLCAFRVTSNSEWYPIQLIAFVFDGLIILAVLRFLRGKPSFSVAALFVIVSDVALFFLALHARSAPYRFPGWFDR